MRRSKEPPVTGQEEKVSIGSMKTSIFMVLNLLIKQRLAGLENSVVRLLRLLHLHLVSKHIKLSLTRLIQIRLRNKVAQIQEGKLSSVPSHSTKSLPSFRSLLLSPWFTRGWMYFADKRYLFWAFFNIIVNIPYYVSWGVTKRWSKDDTTSMREHVARSFLFIIIITTIVDSLYIFARYHKYYFFHKLNSSVVSTFKNVDFDKQFS